jgi:hypothetical protein
LRSTCATVDGRLIEECSANGESKFELSSFDQVSLPSLLILLKLLTMLVLLFLIKPMSIFTSLLSSFFQDSGLWAAVVPHAPLAFNAIWERDQVTLMATVNP